MEWIKTTIKTTQVGAEVVIGMLMSNNISGFEIIDSVERVKFLTETAHLWDYAEEELMKVSSDDVDVVFYVTNDDVGQDMLESIELSLEEVKTSDEKFVYGDLTLYMNNESDENWLHEWKKHFKPIHIGKIVVVPEWEDYIKNEDEVVFIIDPGSAFGTGQHQTTKLCIKSLQKYLKLDDDVLDIGCGSGVLSIISLLLGCKHVFACDIDPAGAIAATKKNTELNGIDLSLIEIHSGDVISDKALQDKISIKKYDVIVANIVADVIIEILPFVKNILKQGGYFISSGIIIKRADDVINAFKKNGFNISCKEELEGWLCVVGYHG